MRILIIWVISFAQIYADFHRSCEEQTSAKIVF